MDTICPRFVPNIQGNCISLGMHKLTFKTYPKDDKADKGKKILKKERPLILAVSASHKEIVDGQAKTFTKRYKLSTGLQIDPKQWDKKRQEPKEAYKEYAALMNAIRAFKGAVTDACNAIAKEGAELTAEAIRARVDGKALAGKVAEVTPGELFTKAIADYIEISGETKRPSTIKTYRSVFSKLREYESKTKPLTFEAIGPYFADHYRAWMLKGGCARAGKDRLLDDTVHKHFTIIKAFMRWAEDRGLHSNGAYKRFKSTKQSKVANISLTEAELLHIQALDLRAIDPTGRGRLDKVRDLLVFACYTGQRWSDVQAFSGADVKADTKGHVWRFVSKKTGKHIAIPLHTFTAPALAVLVKYDYKLPKITAAKFNKYVKEVGKIAGITEPIKLTRRSGNKEMITTHPKYEFMTSHVARRTFITILLNRGVAPTHIMKFTGHSDLKTLMRYYHGREEDAFEALGNIGQLGQSTIRKAV